MSIVDGAKTDLARSGLAVGQHGAVVALEHPGYQRRGRRLVNRLLVGCAIKGLVEAEAEASGSALF